MYTDVVSYNRQQYFQTLDHTIHSTETRFLQEGFSVLRQTEQLLFEAVANNFCEIPETLLTAYIEISTFPN